MNERVQECLRKAHVCQVCCDKPLRRVFIPCGHIVCCEDCADRVEQCPLCRTQIELRHPVYLPEVRESEIITDTLVNMYPSKCRNPSSTNRELNRQTSVGAASTSHQSGDDLLISSRRNITDTALHLTRNPSSVGESLFLHENVQPDDLLHSVTISSRQLNTPPIPSNASSKSNQTKSVKNSPRTYSEPRHHALRRLDKDVLSPQVHLATETPREL